MAMTKCVECGKEISTSASVCPHCGKKAPTMTLTSKVIWAALIIFFAFTGYEYFTDHFAGSSSISSSSESPSLERSVSSKSPIQSRTSESSRSRETRVRSEATSVTWRAENVHMEKTHSNAWCVKGSIRNLAKSSVKGTVRIKFIDINGDVIASYSAYVNDLDPIMPNQAGPFEYFTRPSDFDNVDHFEVLFRLRSD